MIPFFRRIRKTLADDNKPIKYLRYAVGEIVLVVIGILIALQINNWNDAHNLTKKETSLLIEMKSNLESDLEGLKWDINKNEGLLKANRGVLKSLNDGVYHDSLNLYYTWIKGNTVFIKNTSAFKNNYSQEKWISKLYEVYWKIRRTEQNSKTFKRQKNSRCFRISKSD